MNQNASTDSKKTKAPKLTRPCQALCCSCGAIREVQMGGPRKVRPKGFIPETVLDGGEERFIAPLKCSNNCGIVTHAILRHPTDQYRDYAEERDHADGSESNG